MQFRIPPSRIKLSSNETDCKIRNSPRIRAPQREDNIFLLVDENGNPIQNTNSEKVLPFRVYYAKKPAFAAIKAYSALTRIEKQEQEKMDEKELDVINSFLNKYYDEETVKEYMISAKRAKKAPPAFINLRKPESNKIKTYFVEYERILEPNKHEVNKKIVKKAVARPVKDL